MCLIFLSLHTLVVIIGYLGAYDVEKFVNKHKQ